MNTRLRLIAGTTVIFLLLFLPPPFAQDRLSSVVKQVQPSVVTITIRDEAGKATGFGSGFFATEGGQIVTNRHVIVGAFSAEIKTAEGKVYSITKVIAENKEGDLVRLAVDFGRETVRPLRLSRNLPEAGERVLVIGSPLGLEQTVSEGIVSAVRDSGRLIQITAPISPGSSGSPVVNMKGEVIGVATLQFTEGQNLNFAVSAQRLSEMKPGEGKDLAFWTAGQYGQGTEFLKRKNYRAALEAFTAFLKENPDTKYAANAQYYIGAAHYALGQFKQARDTFFKVAPSEPLDPALVPARWRMAAASLVHLAGGKLNALNDIAVLLDNYPQSEEVVKARDMLQEWGKEDNQYVGQKGSLSNLRHVTLRINSNGILMKCANPAWTGLISSDICQKGAALFMQASELRSMVLDMFRRKLPSVVIDEPNLIGITRGESPKNSIQQDWIPVTVYVGSIVEKGNIQFFGVVSVLVIRAKSNYLLNPWKGKIPAPNEQSEEHGMIRYFSGSAQTIRSRISESLDGLLTSVAEHWQRDNPKPNLSSAAAFPQLWRYPNGREAEIKVDGDYLYEKEKHGSYTLSEDETEYQALVELETYCETKRDGSVWSGKCRYSFTGKNFSTPCVIETKEVVTLLTPARIEGKSQRIDYSPLKQKPPACPRPSAEETGWDEFSLTPKE